MTEITSIFKYITTDEYGNHTILPENFNALLKDKSFDTSKLELILTGDQFPQGLKPKLVVGMNTIKSGRGKEPKKDPLPYYRPSVKDAIYTYREKNRDKYNEISRDYYARKSQDPEWKQAQNEKQRAYNTAYRERNKPTEAEIQKKNAEKEAKREEERLAREAAKPPKKPRGRPRKIYSTN